MTFYLLSYAQFSSAQISNILRKRQHFFMVQKETETPLSKENGSDLSAVLRECYHALVADIMPVINGGTL